MLSSVCLLHVWSVGQSEGLVPRNDKLPAHLLSTTKKPFAPRPAYHLCTGGICESQKTVIGRNISCISFLTAYYAHIDHHQNSFWGTLAGNYKVVLKVESKALCAVCVLLKVGGKSGVW